jgi:PadR family transcriptional regulator PadR
VDCQAFTHSVRGQIVGKQQADMIRGTLDMLILKVLSLEPLHGWGICERIQLISQDQLQVNQGSLYPALHKLAQEGWIKSYWGLTENNRRARYYKLTRAGENQLRVEEAHWERLATAVARVMATS